MEMNAARRQTEVGSLPVDWNIIALGECVPLNAPICYGILMPGQGHPGGIPVVKVKDIIGGVIRRGNLLLTSPAIDAEYSRSRLRDGDLLLTIRGSTGRVALVPLELDGANITQDTARVRLVPGLSARYVYYALQAPAMQGQVALHTLGLAVKGINIGDVKKLLCPIPPTKREQESIAEALSDVDALIESLEQLIAKKRLIKKGVMQESLTGKRRLPGFEGEWNRRSLSELADIRSGGTPSTGQPSFWDGGIPWTTPTDITALSGRRHLSTTARTISDSGLDSSSAELIPTGSVLMTSRATIGECAIARMPVTTNQGFKSFVPFPSTDGQFLYYLLTTQKQGFISLCGGSTFLEIGKTQLRDYVVRLPQSKAEQIAVGTVLSDIDDEIEGVEDRLDKARAIKTGMMQQLLTGRTRLV